MTLEDFFTLTEMKDGLTTLTRVNELVSVMQKENDFVAKNIVEAARQWSTVATTIAATENRQCLDHFIQLDGLCLIGRWLKDVQNFSSDTGIFVEESILALLRALEKLHVGSERSISSGIWMTVQKLLGHSSLKIQDRARALFDGWEITRETDAASQVDRKAEVLHDGRIDISINQDRYNEIEEKHVEPFREEKLPLDCTTASQPERVDEELITSPEKAIGDAITENGPLDPVQSSNVSIHVDEKFTVKEEASVHHSGGTDDAKQQMQETGSEKVGTGSVTLEPRALSSGADVATTLESGLEPDLRKVTDADNQGFCSKYSPFSETGNASHKDNWIDDKGFKEQVEECYADALHESSGDNCRWGEEKGNKTYFEVAEKSKENSGDENEDGDGSQNDLDIFKPTTGVKDCTVISKRSDMELDYDMVDPLDIARQVAMEVEREVDCREPSCNSDKRSGGGLRQPDSPDSTKRKQSQSIDGPCKKLRTLTNPSLKALPIGVDPVVSAETLGVERENCIYDVASSQVTEAAQESEANMDKGFSGFDLNQEVCSDDVDRPMNQISTPVPVSRAAAAAAAAAAPGTSITPLHFEGALGWKGSASTSAFRRISEGDRSFSMSELRNNSGQQLDSLDFDLNVAEEGGEDKSENMLFGKQIPNSSGFPSGEESSIEAACPIKSEKLQLDLNHAGDGGDDALLDRSCDGRIFQNQNGHQSPSQSSSSSSKHPSLRNFDLNLNDQQFSIQESLSDDPSSSKSLRIASGASAISIFGAQLELKPKDSAPQTLPLPNGGILDHSMKLNLGRSGGILGMGSLIPYRVTPIYGFNDLASGSGMPFSSVICGQPGGPMPCMVDSYGAPVVPQYMPSAHSFPQPTPLMMSMTAAGTSNGAVPSQQNFDLNFGLMTEEGGNRETGVVFRQFL